MDQVNIRESGESARLYNYNVGARERQLRKQRHLHSGKLFCLRLAKLTRSTNSSVRAGMMMMMMMVLGMVKRLEGVNQDVTEAIKRQSSRLFGCVRVCVCA